VDFNDITVTLANFCSGAACLCLGKGDADRNGTVEFADVTAILGHWLFEYPCGGGSGQSVAEAPIGRIPAHADFAEEGNTPQTAEAAAMLISDALQSMGYESIEAFVAAIEAMDEDARNAEVRELGRLLGGATDD
jgi:hypothetical protein